MVRRVSVVTGGASGIGRVVAGLRAAAGDVVYVLDADGPGGRQTMGELSVEGAAGEFIELDLTVPARVDEAADRIMTGHGRVDMLATCAGVIGPGALETLSHATWASVLDVNLNGTFYIMQSLARRLIAAGQRSSFVTIASVAASRGEAGRGAYCVSKAAVVALTRLAAAEWSARGIRVNCVAPGYVDTPLLRRAFADRLIDRDTILGRIPMRRLATAGEVAEAIDFLASERASYISGHVLAVDGGFLIDYGVPLGNGAPLEDGASIAYGGPGNDRARLDAGAPLDDSGRAENAPVRDGVRSGDGVPVDRGSAPDASSAAGPSSP